MMLDNCVFTVLSLSVVTVTFTAPLPDHVTLCSTMIRAYLHENLGPLPETRAPTKTKSCRLVFYSGIVTTQPKYRLSIKKVYQ